LFIDEGMIRTDFNVAVKMVPDLPLPSLQVVNQLLVGLENENLFNRLLVPNRAALSRLLSGLAVGLTVGLVVFGLFRIMKGRHRVEVDAPLLAARLAKLVPAVGLMEQRRQAMLQEGNLWEEARTLARQCFAPLAETRQGDKETRRQRDKETDIVPSFSWSPGLLVSWSADLSWWQRWSWRRRVSRLWELAHGDRPVRISPQRFSQLTAEVEDVRAALTQGIVCLEGARTSEP